MKRPQYPPLTLQQKSYRARVWRVLCNHRAPYAWDPHHIDLALNNPPRRITFSVICEDVFSQLRGAIPLEHLRYPTGDLLFRWLDRETKRRLPFPSLYDDGIGVLYDLIAKAIPDYQPSIRDKRGWRTMGFAAYLVLRSKRLSRWASHELKVATESGLVPTAPLIQSEKGFDSFATLISALSVCIKSPETWDFIHDMAYGGLSLREIAKRRGIPKSNLSRRVVAPVIECLRAKLIAHRNRADCVLPGNISLIAFALRQCFSEREFRTLFPRKKLVREAASRKRH